MDEELRETPTMLAFTDRAKKHVLAVMEAQEGENLVVLVGITGRSPGGFEYMLDLVEEGEKAKDDIELDLEEFKVFVDRESAPKLKGATVDFVHTLGEQGFKFDNPNSVWSDPKADAIQMVLDNEINPAVAAHGGLISLIDVKENVVYLRLGGGCQGCGMADVTLKQGIEKSIRFAVPEVGEILDVTDHASGRNPYYTPSKK